MRVLIAIDKFKGSLTAREAGEALAEGLRAGAGGFEIVVMPLADGGEGTFRILTEMSHGTIAQATVTDPLNRKVSASYGISGDKKTAFIEMAQASGLLLLKPAERNPARTTSFGTGELIIEALKAGVHRIVLGIGGTATNDGGTGMAAALGYEFLDDEGKVFIPVGETLPRWKSLRLEKVDARLAGCEVITICDVDNPLTGPRGAAEIFAPQKGATSKQVPQLDNALRHFAGMAEAIFHVPVDFPGAGAGGGMGAGARIFLGSRMMPGFEFVAGQLNLEKMIHEADFVITGEGKLDSQSLHGKVVAGVAAIAGRLGKPCVAVAGQVALREDEMAAIGLQQAYSLVNDKVSPDEAMKNAARSLRDMGKAIAHGILRRG